MARKAILAASLAACSPRVVPVEPAIENTSIVVHRFDIGPTPSGMPCGLATEVEAREEGEPTEDGAGNAIWAGASYEADLNYDEDHRLTSASGHQVTGEGIICWDESWAYDAERLVRHEFVFKQCGWPMDGSRPDEWRPDEEWSCYQGPGAPLPKVETWQYDGRGRVTEWTTTGWGDDFGLECVWAETERFTYADGNVVVERLSKSIHDFNDGFPSYRSFQGCPEDDEDDAETCDSMKHEQYLTWLDLGAKAAAAPPTEPEPPVTYTLDEHGRVTAWDAAGQSGSLVWQDGDFVAAHETTRVTPTGTTKCSGERQFMFNEEGLVVAEQLSESGTSHWEYEWGPGGALENAHLVGGESEVRYELDKGRLIRFVNGDFKLLIDYCTVDAPAITRAMPFVVALGALPDNGAEAPLPSLLQPGALTGPVALPDVWGSGRPSNALEPGGSAWPLCRD